MIRNIIIDIVLYNDSVIILAYGEGKWWIAKEGQFIIGSYEDERTANDIFAFFLQSGKYPVGLLSRIGTESPWLRKALP